MQEFTFSFFPNIPRNLSIPDGGGFSASFFSSRISFASISSENDPSIHKMPIPSTSSHFSICVKGTIHQSL
tara:strand:- start:166 stop:378 length:213 start_codon:yes stop_codon:yes gene_type:complete